MSEFLLREDLTGGLALVKLNRSPVNALNADFLHAIATLFVDLENDPAVRAVVLTSAYKVLSAGLDLREMQSASLADETALVDGLNATFSRLYGFPKPLVTAVNGAAIAGGLFFVLSADYAVAHTGVKLGLSEVRVGANFPIGPLEIARSALSAGAFRRLLLSGRPVSAEQAMEYGFVDAIASDGDLIDHALSIARDYSTAPQTTFASVKAQMRSPALAIINAAIEARSDPTRGGWFTPDTRAAMAAMLGK